MPGSVGVLSGFVDRRLGRTIGPASELSRMGKGGGTIASGGNMLVFSSAAGVGNGADTTEDTLFTAALPANTLDVVGRQILLEAFGSIGATNAIKTVRMYWGATAFIVAQITPAAVTVGDWSAQILITKTASNAQIAVVGTDFSAATNVRGVSKSLALAETDTAAITVKITGQSSVGTANNAICNLFTISGYN